MFSLRHQYFIIWYKDRELPYMPSPSSRGQFLRCQPPTSSISASSRLRILMTTRVFQILVLLMSKFGPLVNSGECLGIMLSSTKIRLFYSLSFCDQISITGICCETLRKDLGRRLQHCHCLSSGWKVWKL